MCEDVRCERRSRTKFILAVGLISALLLLVANANVMTLPVLQHHVNELELSFHQQVVKPTCLSTHGCPIWLWQQRRKSGRLTHPRRDIIACGRGSVLILPPGFCCRRHWRTLDIVRLLPLARCRLKASPISQVTVFSNLSSATGRRSRAFSVPAGDGIIFMVTPHQGGNEVGMYQGIQTDCLSQWYTNSLLLLAARAHK
jgi:hypothetical protein